MVRRDPVARLPLVARKNLRDSFETPKQDIEGRLSQILGQPWTIKVDPLALYAYAEEDSWASTSLGDLIVSYIEGAEYQLKYFLERNGDGAKDEINEICSAHVLTIDVDEKNTVYYCGAKVSSQGELVILFKAGDLGTNTSNALDSNNLSKALNEAPSTTRPMSYVARASIRNDYESNIKDVQEKLNKILGQDITIVPNFEANFEKLKSKAGTDSNWEDNFGNFHYLYFDALVSQLQYDKFGEDDMLQEALLEVMEKRAVHFRIVDQTKKSYNETVIEDGILYLQAPPAEFGTNISHVANDLMNML
ncbi:hypothetical protein DER45DRAFT_647449 [Fusarium avenaceum]|nr:hypothetical protein DER45DRAFT_647449 [Fusarium avenaceum]